MKAYFNIYLTIDGVRVWMNKYSSKNSLSISHNLCSTAWKSAVDTASCKLVFNDRNVQELADIISKMVEAQQSFPPKDIGFEAMNSDESKTLFRGFLDLGKLSIESSSIPESISISVKSCIDRLEKKPTVNFVMYPASVKSVVERCLAEAGFGSIVEWKSDVASKNIEVPFVVTDEDSDTWRDKIDTLLMEMGGHTIAYNHQNDRFYVSKVNDESKPFSDVPVNYHVKTKLKSTTTKFAKDGVVVSYGNVKMSANQIVYWHDISLSEEGPLVPKGDIIEPGVYYPFDSDITKTYEEYSSENLDYGQLIGNTRKANEHLGIYYVDPASTKVKIIASDMDGKGISDWYDNSTYISPEGGFTYPAGGEFYPRKAWLSFKNKTDKSVNITRFSISGDTYYSDAEYRIVMPVDCKDPEEYTSKFISDTNTAREYANFLMNQKRFGSDTSTWTERWQDHDIGDKVKIRHKSGNIINAVIVKKDSIIYGDEIWASVTAVSVDGWSYEQPALIKTSTQRPNLLDPYEYAKKNGFTGSREQWEGRNDIYYLWSSSEKELRPKNRAYWKLGGKWMLFKNLPVGDFAMQDWMKNWNEVMEERSEEYNYLWAKVGIDGEPFLLQGQPAKIFALSLSSNTYVRDERRVDEYQQIKIELQVWGYFGTPRIEVSDGSFDEKTGILTIPYNNSYNTITVTASMSKAPTQVAYISVINETEYGRYWGTSDSEPSDIAVEGDSWFNLSDKLIYRYTNGSWVLLSKSGVSDAEISQICSRAQKDALSIIEAGSLTASDYAYFNTIIAGTITADYISSKDIRSQNFSRRSKGYRLTSSTGKLEAVDAELSGDISSDSMCSSYAETLSSSELSVSSELVVVKYLGGSRSVNAIRIDSLKALTVCGVYIFDGGSIVRGSTTITASEDSPFYVIKEPYTSTYNNNEEAFSIVVRTSSDQYGLYLGRLYLYPDDDSIYLHDQGDAEAFSLKLSKPRKALLASDILPINAPSGAFSTGSITCAFSDVDIGSKGSCFKNIYCYNLHSNFQDVYQIDAQQIFSKYIVTEILQAKSPYITISLINDLVMKSDVAIHGTTKGTHEGTHIGNVNSEDTSGSYKVWGAVFN